jgi:peptidoglycan hydrolase-like protein with peptidoglycan-binding domain
MVYTAAQIRERIAEVKMQMAAMQTQLTRLETALKEAELKGTAQINISGATKTSVGVSDSGNLKLNAIKRMLYLGQKGDDVRKLQEILRAKGYLNANADGSFGPKTMEALSAYQRAMKLKVSGSVDADTLNSLNALTTVSGSTEIQ